MADRKAPQDNRTQTVDPTSEAWNKLPWRKLEQHGFRIQKRIYQASQRGNTRAVHKLQKLLMKSEAARLLAVRRVTQDNQGKKTAGVDGVKNVKPADRLLLAKQVHPKYWKHQKPKPVRRVWIPKPGKAEKRPLGIPTMLERAKQALVKAGLEPEWEAVFDANSYGFRPGRSCHDAIAAILNHIRYKPKFVLDADIKGCFDNINQEALLKKLHTYSAMRQLVKAWLKAGVLEGVEFSPTEAGTPQGGVVSPLLANIALHGLEEAAAKAYRKKKEKPVLIRYADDFLIFHPEKEVLDEATKAVTTWLENMGLILSPKKTRVTHTLSPYEGSVGFEFLGFTVRQFPVGKTNTGKDTKGRPLGFKTIIRPSKEAIKRHVAETKTRIRKLRGAPQEKLIRELNPVIRGWANYYRTVVSTRVYSECDNILYYQLVSWAKWRHPYKGMEWIMDKYWRPIENRKWVFSTPEEMAIRRHSQTSIISPYAKVKGNASPYDGDLLYWSQRLKNHPMMRGKLARLLQMQQGKCRWCELTFREEDLIEIDHIDGNHENDKLSNQMALHRHCHDEKHTKTPKEWKYAAGVDHK
jgi:RNA-directed DNA polymerase